MDCFFHARVPAVAACPTCSKGICATCRDSSGLCPSCRLAARIEGASSQTTLTGARAPYRGAGAGYAGGTVVPPRAATVSVGDPLDPVESRALVALGYPLLPLALLSLLERRRSRFLKRAALQAIGFNLAFAAFWGVLQLMSALAIPWIGVESAILIPFLIPLFLVASVYYGVKTWNGDEVRVPIVSDWIEDHLPAA